jgi:hypothetical protein
VGDRLVELNLGRDLDRPFLREAIRDEALAIWTG